MSIEGDLRFLSHRDCARAIERTAARASLPVHYTQGFNPHPVLSLLCPRPVAVASRDDLLVVRLTRPEPAESLPARMNACAPRGMCFLRARELADHEHPRPLRACYVWPVPPARAEDLRVRLRQYHQAETWPVQRSTPAKRRGAPPVCRTFDLKPYVEDLRLQDDALRWTLVTRQDGSAKPAEVLDALGLDGQVDLASAVRTAVDYGI